jgi:hypothetical protein
MMRLLAAVALVAAFPAAAAAAPTRIPLKPLPHAAVGRVDGTRALIAFSVKRERLRVYVCDGTLKRDPTISTWFRRRAWNGAPVVLRAGGHTLRITGRFAGRLDGHRFRVRPATGVAGLLKGRHGRTRATWIVLRNGHKRGAMVPTRPPKCRFILVSGPGGTQQWVQVCG